MSVKNELENAKAKLGQLQNLLKQGKDFNVEDYLHDIELFVGRALRLNEENKQKMKKVIANLFEIEG